MKYLLVSLIVLFVSALLCLSFYIVDWDHVFPQRQKHNLEVFKFFLTTALVGGAALFYSTLRDREQKTADAKQAAENARQRDLKKLEKFLMDFNSVYNTVKFIRRELRHETVLANQGSLTIGATRYQELMRQLNESQLEIEKFKRLFISQPHWLASISDGGIKCLKAAEGYLRYITAEYEASSIAADQAKTELVFSSETQLFKFIAKRDPNQTGSQVDLKTERDAVKYFFHPMDRFFELLARSIDAK